MGNNLLITGVPGVGKTTAIKKSVAMLPHLLIRGFVTDEIRGGKGREGFTIATMGGERHVFAHVGFSTNERVGRYGVDVGMIDRVAGSTLGLDEETDLYVIDEIGKMECFSIGFVSAVTELLDSGRPLLATVACKGHGFIEQVKDRDDVELWQLTKHNRNDVPARVVSWVKGGDIGLEENSPDRR